MPRLSLRPARRRFALRAEALESRALLATFTVNTTADSGAGSLRQAILSADSTPGADVIDFAIGSGPQTIAPLTALPAITDPVTIDGTSQPGYNGTPILEINGAGAGNFSNGLTITTSSTVVRGLVINRFDGNGILLQGNGKNVIQGNYIGTDTTGANPQGNGADGIAVQDSRNNTIGGSTATARNIVSGNGVVGIGIAGNSTGNAVRGNYVGTDVTGTFDVGNGTGGVAIVDARNNFVGGTTAGDRNLISGNSGPGVQLAAFNTSGGFTIGNVIEGNFIGTDATGAADLGNTGDGVDVIGSSNLVGGTSPGAGNVIAFNRGNGVTVLPTFFGGTSSVNNGILSNSISSNVGLGIDLGNNGVTPNGSGYPRFGPNNLQNYPVLNSAFQANGGTTVEGTLQGVPTTTYTLQFFSNPAPDPSGFGEGQDFLGQQAVTTDGSGVADFTLSFPTAVAVGQFVSATATDPTNNTSEFARSVQVAAAASADLGLSAGASTSTITSGSPLTFFLSVSNAGPSNANNVVVSDTLPAGATFVSAQAGQGTFTQQGSNITFNVGTLLPGQGAFLSFVVTPTAVGTISNSATVTANEADPQPANNTAKATVTVQPTVADLGIGGAAFPNPVLVGQHVTLTIPVANGGPDPASAVNATITLPAGLALFTASATQGTTSHNGDTITATLGALDPGAVATITVDAIAVQDGTFTVQSSVAGAADQNDPFALNNKSIIPVTVSTDTTPPIITSDKLIVHNATIQGIALTFSKPLDPATAQDLRNYSLRTAGPDNLFGTPDDVNVPLTSAVYGPQSLTVMLNPRKHLKVGNLYQLMVNGPGSPGITDLVGNVLDGDKNGIADGVFVDYLSRGSHLRPMNNPALLNLPKFHAGRPVPHPPAPRFPSRQVQTTLNFTRNLIQG